jgi:acetyl-CoA decarbonylase/synthase complex subunit epsilon
LSLAESWQRAEVGGPKKALVITKPAVVVTMIRKAKRPIFIVGHEAVSETLSDDKALIDYVIQLAKNGKIPVVATAHIAGEFLKRNFEPTSSMPAVDIANRLIDNEWKGLDGMGQYDLALFIGLPYYMQWILLNSLKHYAPSLKTISLGKTYQPNANWSFSNLTVENWTKSLGEIIGKLGGD